MPSLERASVRSVSSSFGSVGVGFRLGPSFEEARPPGPPRRPELCYPFVNCIRITHAAIAARTNRNKVVQSRLATFAFGNIMPTFVVERTDLVLTPMNPTLAFKPMSHMGNPNLLRQGFGDLLFLIRFSGIVAELHYRLYHVRSILVYLERCLLSCDGGHAERRGIHVIGALVIRRILYSNGLCDLGAVEKFGLELFGIDARKDESHNKEGTRKKKPLFHCLKTRKNEPLSL